MSPIIAAIIFFIGLTIAIGTMMYAIEKRNMFWNIITIGYVIIPMAIEAIITDRHFDYLGALFFVALFLILGWLIVKFEIMKKP
jgi:hypothetical protein